MIMKLESGSLPKLIGSNFRVTSAVMLCISAYVIIPKIANSAQQLSSMTIKGLSSTSSENLATTTEKSQSWKDTYIPPNYGAPNTQRGSGTR